LKELTDYITEKLDINKVKLNDKFPIDGSFGDIIKFLESHGFIEVPNDNKSKLYPEMNKKKGKVFAKCTGYNSGYIRFVDTSNHNIDKDHPVYSIFGNEKYYIEWDINNKFFDYTDVTKEEFLKLLNKKFHWK
jgi:hypothetical protein